MIEFKTTKPKIAINLDGSIEVTFITHKSFLKDYDNIGDKELLVSIKDYHKKRSLSQNAYMWVLINELADKLGIGRDECYRHYIKDYGKVEYIPLKKEAIETFIKVWSKNGLGNFAEIMRDSKLDGYQTVAVYYGSSVYDSKEMARLIEPIVDDCKEQGISTMTYDDIMSLKTDN